MTSITRPRVPCAWRAARCSSAASKHRHFRVSQQETSVDAASRRSCTCHRNITWKSIRSRGSRVLQVVLLSAAGSKVVSGSKEDPRQLVLLIQKAPNWRALKQLHYQRVCISHPLLSATVLCKLPALVLPLHPVLTNTDIRELQGFVAFLINEVDNSVLKKARNVRLPVEERGKLSGLLVKCLYALSLLDLPDCPKPEWIPHLCSAVVDCSDLLGAAEVASCVRAISQLQGLDASHVDVRDLAQLGLRALQLEVTNLSLQHTAWLLLGLASLKCNMPAKVLNQALQHAALQAQASKQGAEGSNPDTRWGQEEEQAGVLLQSLSDLLSAMSLFKQHPSAEMVSALCQDTDALLQHSSPGAASELLHSLVTQGYNPSAAWMQRYFEATAGQLAGLKGSTLARQAEAVLRVGEPPSISWLSRLSATLSARAGLLRLGDLATCCSCLGHFEFQPLPAQLGNIVAALPDTDVTDTEQLVSVLEVYAYCGVRPKQAVAEKLEAATKQLLSRLTLHQFNRLVITLKRPGWSSAQQLLDSFMPRSRALLKTATPAQLVGYLQALKTAAYLCWDKTQLLPVVNRVYQVVSDLTPTQCLDVVESITAIGLWPYTEIMSADAAGPTAGSPYQGPLRAIPAGGAVVEPVPWLYALLDKIQRVNDDLPPIRCGALLTSLRLLAASQHVEEVKRASRSLLPLMEKLLDGKLKAMTYTSDLCGMFLSFTLLGHTPSSRITAQWADVVCARASAITPSDAAVVLQGIACMPRSSQGTFGPVIDKVLRAAVAKVEEAPSDVVEVMSLAATLRSHAGSSLWMEDGALLDSVMQKLKQRWDKLSPEVLAKAIKVFATVGAQVPSAVIQLHANAMYPKAAKASPSDLMDVVWSYRQLGFPLKSSQKDKLLVALAEAPTSLLQGCKAAQLIATMQELQHRGMGELSQWISPLEAALSRDLPELGVEDVVAAMVLMDVEGHRPSTAIADCMAVALDQSDISQNVEHYRLAEDGARILATWGHPVGQRPWLARLSMQQRVSSLPSAAPAQVIMWLWQYQRVRFVPPDEWFAAALARLSPSLTQLDAADFVRLVESLHHFASLNRLTTVQKQLLLDAVWQTFTSSWKEVASTDDVELFCGMLHWMGRVRYQPDPKGRDWVNNRLKLQKKLLPFYSTQQLVWLLGSLSPLGNTNAFMAQELRSAFITRVTSMSEPVPARQLAAGLAACASAPGPMPGKLVQRIKALLVEEGGSDGVCVPELVWALAAVKGTLDIHQLRGVCEKVAHVAPHLKARQRYLLVTGLAQLAGSSLWRTDVWGAAATGKLLDSLCSVSLLEPPAFSPSELLEWMRNLLLLGYTPGTKFLDAAMDYLTLIDPLAREVGTILGAAASPHSVHLTGEERQLLQETMTRFGYAVPAAFHESTGTIPHRSQQTLSLETPTPAGSPAASPAVAAQLTAPSTSSGSNQRRQSLPVGDDSVVLEDPTQGRLRSERSTTKSVLRQGTGAGGGRRPRGEGSAERRVGGGTDTRGERSAGPQQRSAGGGKARKQKQSTTERRSRPSSQGVGGKAVDARREESGNTVGARTEEGGNTVGARTDERKVSHIVGSRGDGAVIAGSTRDETGVSPKVGSGGNGAVIAGSTGDETGVSPKVGSRTDGISSARSDGNVHGRHEGFVEHTGDRDVPPRVVEVKEQGSAKAQPGLNKFWTALSSIAALVTNQEGNRS